MIRLSDVTLPAIVTTSLVTVSLGLYLLRRMRKRWVKVGVVGQLVVHPIKSAKGVVVPELTVTKTGVRFGRFRDRAFVVVGPNNRMLNLVGAPKIITITVSFAGDAMVLEDVRGRVVHVPVKEQITDNDKIVQIT